MNIFDFLYLSHYFVYLSDPSTIYTYFGGYVAWHVYFLADISMVKSI